MYEENEIRKSQIVAALIPKHCNKETRSAWEKVKEFVGFDTGEKCLGYEKELSMNSHHKVNPLKIVSTLISEIFVDLASSVGHLLGRIYEGLSNYLPFYLVPIFLLVLILAPMVCFVQIVVRIVSIWFWSPWKSFFNYEIGNHPHQLHETPLVDGQRRRPHHTPNRPVGARRGLLRRISYR